MTTQREQQIRSTEQVADFLRLHSRLIKYSLLRGDSATAIASALALEEKAFEMELAL